MQFYHLGRRERSREYDYRRGDPEFGEGHENYADQGDWNGIRNRDPRFSGSKRHSILSQAIATITEPEKKIPCSHLSLTDPEAFARFLLLPADTLQNVILQLANNNKQALTAYNIRVREIWVGNLSPEINDRSLKAIFERFGPIENIEMFQKNNLTFAFIRFERVSQATKAFENQDELGLELRSPLKISFADFLKRTNIVGDSVEIVDVGCITDLRTRKT